MKKNNTTSNPFKVGDIISTTWGYSMTLVDFYQVVRVTPCKVELRSIEQEPEFTGFLSGVTRPKRDAFFQDSGPYSVKPGQLCKVRDNYVLIPSYPGAGDCNYGRLWTGQPKTFNHCD